MQTLEQLANAKTKKVFEIFQENESFQSKKQVELKEIKAKTDYLLFLSQKVVTEAKVLCVKEGKTLDNVETKKTEEENYIKNSDMSDFDSDVDSENSKSKIEGTSENQSNADSDFSSDTEKDTLDKELHQIQ